MYSFDTPVLYLVFNRLDTVKRTFEQIRQQKPKELFIAADGAREGFEGEEKKCSEVKKYILSRIDWSCEVKTLFRESNLGCKYAVSSAIDWFFDHVEQGIILEDDILPNSDFFYFLSKMLDYHKFDQEVMMISGLNVSGNWKRNNQDYHFGKFGGIWGWGTWKRAWDHYDVNISDWADPLIQDRILNNFPSALKVKRFKMYEHLYNQEIDTWDLQWTFSKLLNNGLNVVPSVNLVKNIGCGPEATHTTGYHPWSDLQTGSLTFPIKKNERIATDRKYDLHHLSFELTHEHLFKKAIKKILRLFNWI